MSESGSPIYGFNDDHEIVSTSTILRSGRQLVVSAVNPLRGTVQVHRASSSVGSSVGGNWSSSIGSSRESLAWDGIQQNPSFVGQTSAGVEPLLGDDSRWSTSTHLVSVPSTIGSASEEIGAEDQESDTGSQANTVMPAHNSANNSASVPSPNMKREIILLVESVEEDIVPFQNCNVSVNTLRRLITEAQALKVQLRQVVVVFQETEQDDSLIERVNKAKKSLMDFLVSAEAKLCELQETGIVAPEPIAQNANTGRVRIVEANSKRAHEEASKLIDAYIGISDCSKSGEDGVRRAVDLLAISDDAYSDLMDTFKSLNLAALDLGCEEVAHRVEEDKSHVRQFRKDAKEAISVSRRAFGLVDSGSRRIGLSDLKPPEFSGDQSRPLDFFSFKTEWDRSSCETIY